MRGLCEASSIARIALSALAAAAACGLRLAARARRHGTGHGSGSTRAARTQPGRIPGARLPRRSRGGAQGQRQPGVGEAAGRDPPAAVRGHSARNWPAAQALPRVDRTVRQDDVWQRIRDGFAMPDLAGPLVAEKTAWYVARPGVPEARVRAQPPVPVPHRRRDREARPADRARAAADGGELVQPDGLLARACLGALAVHPRHRQALRAGAELVVRRAARHRRLDLGGARLPEGRLRDARRLAPGARLLQLGRERGGAGAGEEPRAKASRSTIRASTCRPRRAITCPSCRR